MADFLKTPEDIVMAISTAISVADDHAYQSYNKQQFEHAYQWLALAYELRGMQVRLYRRTESLLRPTASKESIKGVLNLFDRMGIKGDEHVQALRDSIAE
jgi:hypothetical protein